MFYLKHPLHGFKHAYTLAEMNEDKKHGWEEYEPKRQVPAIESAKNTESGSIKETSTETAQTNLPPVERTKRKYTRRVNHVDHSE